MLSPAPIRCKSSLRDSPAVMRRLRGVLLGVMPLLAVAFGAASVSCQSGPDLRTKQLLAEAAKRRVAAAVAAQAGLPPCPPAGVSPLQASQPGTGHHKVTLSWNASAHSSNPEKNAVGYCLYRSTTQNAAKQKPTCNACEQVNSVPIVGTACVDDLVRDSTKYYYVVTAIDLKKELSASSNEVPAPIPAATQTAPIGAASPSPPFCRGASAAR